MNGPTEQALRTAVRELADEAQTLPGLADRARARGRRLRRRRQLAATGGALAALVALAAPFVWLRPSAPAAGPAAWGPPSAPAESANPVAPAPTGDWTRSPLTLPGGWLLAGATSTGGPAERGYALDRTRGRYVGSDRYDEVWAAPRGDTAAVVDYDRRTELGLLDLASGEVRWVRTGGHIMTPHWSPDGRRLALTLMDKDSGDFSLGVLSATGTWRTFPVDDQEYLCTDQCFFTWNRDGGEVALQQTDPTAPRSESEPHARRGVQFFSPDDGRPTRLVPVKGDPAGAWSWSPDGGRVVVNGRQGPEVVEVATGRVIGPAPSADAAWGSDDRLLYRDRRTGEMVLADLDGRELVRQALPDALGLNMVLLVAPR
ncbi:TolB family protein [Micromonospora sp. H33]|uniref:TolB family protein n=1 Tax=Micromonospora sp. H33 TaxID=3452215 RepID=UPI003F8BEFE2